MATVANFLSARGFTSAAAVGTDIYVFGGLNNNGWINEIVKVPVGVSPVVPVLVNTLPTARGWTSACSDGARYIYVFGGEDANGQVNDVIKYDSQLNVVTNPYDFAIARSKTSAICNGNYAYTFGGWNGASRIDDIVRYDIAGNTAGIIGHLPQAASGTSVAWDPLKSAPFVFGGRDVNGNCLDKIVKFTPSDNLAVNVGAALTSGRYGTSAAYHDTLIHVIAGDRCAAGYTGGVRIFNSARGSCCTTMDSMLSSARYGTSAVAVRGFIYVFGGKLANGYTTEIVKYTPSALVGAQVHSQWMDPAQFSQADVKGRTDASHLQVIPVGSRLYLNNHASLISDWINLTRPVPSIPELNTFQLYVPPNNKPTDAQLSAIFDDYLFLAGQTNVKIVVGANEPLTHGRGWQTKQDAIDRVRQEYSVWHTLFPNGPGICHKFTNPVSNYAQDGSQVTWADMESMWNDAQDAVCYDWYPEITENTNATLTYLRDQANNRGKAVHVLESFEPNNDPEWLKDNADRIYTGRGDTWNIYHLIDKACCPVDLPKFPAWVLETNGAWTRKPPGDMLEAVLVPT